MPLAKGWVCYGAWNEAIRAHLFDGRFADRPVYLDLDDEFVAKAFSDVTKVCPQDIGDPRTSLLGSLERTLEPPGSSRGVFARHRGAARRWREDYYDRGQRDDTPSFLAFLLVLVLVAEEMAAEGKLAANDYFGRLTNTINGALNASYSKREVQRSYYLHVDGPAGTLQGGFSLWSLLNEWLEAHDDELGLPTSYPVDGREYVSVPVGQSLFRRSDREQLYRLFAQAFGEYRSPTEEEMTEVLTVGLRTPPFSTALSNMWRRDANKRALVQRALVELASWDSTWETERSAVGISTASRALLRAVVRELPRPTLTLSLTARVSDRVVGDYHPADEAGELDRRCLSEGEAGVTVEKSPFGSQWADFSPAAAVNIAEVLVRCVELRRNSHRLTRRYRAVSVLQLDPQEQVYVETDRAQTARPVVVIASEGLADETADMLEAVARPGWRRRSGSALMGVPAGWVAFTGVEIVGKLPDEATIPDELTPLVPPSRLDLELVGGLVLPGGRRAAREWHSKRPPEVIATHGDLATLIQVSLVEGAAQSDATIIGKPVGVGVFEIPARLAADGVLEIRAAGGGRLASARLRLRSGDSPRTIDPASAVQLLANEDAVIVDVNRPRGDPSQRAVGQGSVVEQGAPSLPLEAGIPSSTDVSDLLGSEEDATSEDDVGPALTRVPDDLPACVLRPGAHHWLLPTSSAATVTGECKLCGLTRRHNNRYVSRERAARMRAAASKQTAREDTARVRSAVAARVSELEAADAEAADDWDLLLDALCAVGSGTWATFSALATQAVPGVWPREVARVLASLGHVEFEVGAGDRLASTWSVCPPALVIGSGDRSFLAGRRSDRLLASIAAVAEKAGGSVAAERLPSQPALIEIAGVDGDEVEAIAQSTDDDAARVEFAGRASDRLLSRLPTLGRLRQLLAETPLAPRFAETFDLGRLRWARNDGLVTVGAAVRTVEGRRIFGVVDSVDRDRATLRLGSYQLVKHLSASMLSKPLIAYEFGDQSLSVPLGADLPWLYERVAVLCSGRRPERVRGRVRYEPVPETVAHGLWSRLGPAEHREAQ